MNKRQKEIFLQMSKLFTAFSMMASSAAMAGNDFDPVIFTPKFNNNHQSNNNNNHNQQNNNQRKYNPQNRNNTQNINSDKPTIETAEVDEEYSCPLFENRPYETLNLAIDALTASMNNIPSSCQSQKANLESVQDSNAKISQSIKILQTFTDATPEDAANSLNEMQDSLQTAIQGINNIGQVFSSNELLNSDCGKQVMSSGRVLTAINDIATNLAPYALLVAAVNPVAGGAARFALMGGVVATNTIATLVKMIDDRTYDMTLPEQRRAVLQNTCQYAKVATKVRYLQLAQSGQISEITADLNKKIQSYKMKYSLPSEELKKTLAIKTERDKSYALFRSQLKEDSDSLNELNAQTDENQNQTSFMCAIGIELAKQAQGGINFPATILNHLNSTAEFTKSTGKIQLITLNSLYQYSAKKLLDLSKNNNPKQVDEIAQACSDTTESWLKGLNQMSKVSLEMISQDRQSFENNLTKNNEYRIWKTQTQNINHEKTTADRIVKVMKELAKDNSVIDRSELDQRMNELRAGLLGKRGTFHYGKSPVLSWLAHTADEHTYAISHFDTDLGQIKRNAYLITETAQNSPAGFYTQQPGTKKKTTAEIRQMFKNDAAVVKTLSNLTIAKLGMGSREQELVCQDLETAWLDWSASIDHLGAMELMCDMLDPYLNNKVETGILDYCRGTVQYNGKVTKKSELTNMKVRITSIRTNGFDTSLQSTSYKHDSLLISKKLNELKCPMPSTSVMGN